MKSFSNTWFRVMMIAGLGAALTVVLSILLAQTTYLAPGKMLATLGQKDVRFAMALSMGTATAAAAAALAVAVPAAYALHRSRFRGVIILDALLDIPVLLSPVALGLALLLVFRTAPGSWIERHLLRFVFEIPGIVLAQFVLALALEIRVVKSAYDEINPRYEQVARSLGCTAWGAFRTVTLPLIRPGLLAAFILGWCRAIGDFGATAMIAGAVPQKTETVPVAVYLSLAAVNLDKAVALSLLLTAVAFIALLLVRLLGRRTIKI